MNKNIALMPTVVFIVAVALSAVSSASTLIMDCTLCGCPVGQVCNPVTKLCVDSCIDGTPYGECSDIKPKYCDNGNLINKCQTCGCPTSTPDCYPSGECRAAPSLSSTVQAQYPYDDDITIPVTVQNLDYGYMVSGKITDSLGNTIQEISTGTWTSPSQVMFYFNSIPQAGSYTFKAWITRPVTPYDNIWSAPKGFVIKAPLVVEFTISDPNQYTVKDCETRLKVLTPNGEIVPISKQLSAKIDGVSTVIHPKYIDEGSGVTKIVIPKEDLRPGIMQLEVTVQDQKQQYEAVTKTISNIKVIRPPVTVGIDTPVSATVMDVADIKVSTSDVHNKPMDIDTLELIITYPDGITKKHYYKNAIQNDFYQFQTGQYQVNFQFTGGGAYKFHAVAMKSLYNSGANDPDPRTVVTGGIDPSCDVSDACDPNCPDDPDCVPATGPPFWMWLVIGLIIVGAVVLIWKR